MNTAEATEHIHKWISEHLTVPRKQTAGLPLCPFAKTALYQRKVDIVFYFEGDPYHHILNTALNFIETGQKKSVTIVVFAKHISDARQFGYWVRAVNELINPRDALALIDHPDDALDIRGVVTSNGAYTLVLIQRLEELNREAEALHKKGYYENWDEKSLNEVVRWRTRQVLNKGDGND